MSVRTLLMCGALRVLLGVSLIVSVPFGFAESGAL
jgi:hypothetical protein